MGRAFKARKLRVSASRFGMYLMSEGFGFVVQAFDSEAVSCQVT